VTASTTDRAARAAVLGALSRLDSGTVVLHEPGRRTRRYGTGGPDRFGHPALAVEVTVHDPAAYRPVATDASAGLGQAYADGLWDCDDLTGFLRLLSRSVRRFESHRNRWIGLARPMADRLRGTWAGADPDRDRHNIAAHYDLGNDFFATFLDETMTYSSAIFEPGRGDLASTSLAEAQTTKLDRMCQLLQLAPDDRVIEIGTGWGSFATHAASCYDARVTTTTISAEQYDWARKRVAAEGLSHRVQVRNDDYRELTGTYDRLASIEMIEAVDWRELDTFIATCTRLLEPDGLMALQAIVIPGHRWAGNKDRRDFIKTHIFPGGCLPSIESLNASISRVSDLTLIELDDYGLHYGETLRRWRANLDARTDDLAAMGLDERFVRLWRFYLCYCEAGFDERDISVIQCLLARPGHRPSAPFGR
jgi:cyclopropane-fatty-acyl-phospholipid synthase